MTSPSVRPSRARRLLAVVATTAVAAGLVGTALVGTATSADAATPSVPPLGGILAAAHDDIATCALAAAGHAACQSRVVTDLHLRPAATTTYSSGYAPAQLRKAYGLTGDNTTTVAVVDAYANPNAAADLAKYRQTFGLGTARFTQYNQNGGTALPAGDTGWGQEEMLDLEMVSAICPGCAIVYVGANSTSFDDLGAAVDTAVAKGAAVVSNSYGGTEDPTEASSAAHYDHPGVAITVSSGDSGYGVEAPAAFRTVTAVGGTNLVLAGDDTRKSETVWGSRLNVNGGAGSGCSAYIAKPSWQKDTACAKRAVADVAAVADPNTGVAVYSSYGSTGGQNWYVFGGTSVAAPIIGGVYGLSGNTAGVPASIAYSHTSALYDVTSGSNGLCLNYLCKGTKGYDGPTGLGTPKGTAAF
ncbi:S53 family peptidase [Jatrophihabitans sp. YIM 134969]